MVTQQDFIHRLKSQKHLTSLHHSVILAVEGVELYCIIFVIKVLYIGTT